MRGSLKALSGAVALGLVALAVQAEEVIKPDIGAARRDPQITCDAAGNAYYMTGTTKVNTLEPACADFQNNDGVRLWKSKDLKVWEEVGLVWNLATASLDLKSDPPTLTVAATYSKHRREDVLPLRTDAAALLRELRRLKLPHAPVFPPITRHTARMLREDLKTAGIPYVNDQGRYADFHALRHTFITNLAGSGVHPKTAQALARHSDINLTMSRYTHSVLEAQSEAVNLLPDLNGEMGARTAATGTEGVATEAGRTAPVQSVLAFCLAKQERFQTVDSDLSGQKTCEIAEKPHEPATPQRAYRGPLVAEEGKKEMEAATGFEPVNDGFANRCLGPLGYAASGPLAGRPIC